MARTRYNPFTRWFLLGVSILLLSAALSVGKAVAQAEAPWIRHAWMVAQKSLKQVTFQASQALETLSQGAKSHSKQPNYPA